APVWRLLRLMMIPLAVFIVAITGVLHFAFHKDAMQTMSGVGIMTVAILLLILLVVFVVSGAGSKWFVTDDGLKWVQFGNRIVLTGCKDIYHMQPSPPGFSIRW